jgi:hypothetical protein
MSILDRLRQGFRYMLMCMGVSSPASRQTSRPPLQPSGTPKDPSK